MNMVALKKHRQLAGCFLLAVITCSPTSLAAQQVKFRPWVNSYQQAIQESRRTGKPIMLCFTGSDWSHMSQQLSRDVLASRDFAKWSSRNVIKLEVDFPKTIQLPAATRTQNNALINKFRSEVTTYPTVLFIDAEENVLGKCSYKGEGARHWVIQAGRILYRKVDKIARLTGGQSGAA